MSKFGIALMTAAAISLLSGCQAAKEKHPTQEELIRQMQQRAAAPDTHTLPPGKATQDQLMRYAFTLVDANYDFATINSRVLALNEKLADKLDENEIMGSIMISVGRALAKRAVP